MSYYLLPKQQVYANNSYLDFISRSVHDEWLEYQFNKKSSTDKTILSLFDYTGNWARPYFDAGYNVICIDIKHGHDINDFCVEYLIDELGIDEVHGILAGVPCTDFACSGARWFSDKDKDGRTRQSIELVMQTLRTIEFYHPVFWTIENPVGRMPRLIEALNVKPFYFNPCDYGKGHPGEDYTKKTGLWGVFTPPTKENIGEDRSVFPAQGSKMHKLYGGKSEKTKAARSITPNGFAKAFYQCNQ